MANPAEDKTYGAIASFDKTPEVYKAAEQVREAGFLNWDVFAPFPIHGLDGAMGLKRSPVPRFTLVGGVLGFLTGMLITWYMNAFDYPLIVGGKPFWSPVFPFPVMYELTILFAAFGTLSGMFISNRLPRHHHPLFDYEAFAAASDDTFFIFIDQEDPQFDPEKTQNLLKRIGGKDITLIKA